MMRALKKIPMLVTAFLMIMVLLFIGATLLNHFQTGNRIRDRKNTIQQEQAVFYEMLEEEK